MTTAPPTSSTQPRAPVYLTEDERQKALKDLSAMLRKEDPQTIEVLAKQVGIT